MTKIEWTSVTIDRFWSYVERGSPEACWRWTRGFFGNGYGQFRVGARKVRAHRAAYELTRGSLGQLRACHRCDNRWCCNPLHIYAGADADKARDRNSMGRHRTSTAPRPSMANELNPSARVTREQVDEIRQLARAGAIQRELAERFGLSQSQVGNIVRGKCWAP